MTTTSHPARPLAVLDASGAPQWDAPTAEHERLTEVYHAGAGLRERGAAALARWERETEAVVIQLRLWKEAA